MGQTAGGTSYADRGHFPRGRTAANVKGHQKGGHGGVAERLKAPVLKTGSGESRSWVRIPPPPSASLQFSGFSSSLREKRAFGRNPAPKVHRRTGLLRLKHEFWRFLSARTFGGGLSF
jgi:hypothetical protein